jgi:hypothetical protein
MSTWVPIQRWFDGESHAPRGSWNGQSPLNGIGLPYGCRDVADLRVGNVVGLGRVEVFELNHLRLRTTMKLPVPAWPEYEVTVVRGYLAVRKTAIFDPGGLSGLVYLYTADSFRSRIFAGMLKALVGAAGVGRVRRLEQRFREIPVI